MYKSSNKLAYNILQLQNKIKRDPPSYYDEFFSQHQHYSSLLELFKISPQEYNENVENLVMFLAQVSTCYKSDLESFPGELMQLLRSYSTVLNPAMRLCFCRALILMNNRNFINGTDLLKLWFELLRCSDKGLRTYLKTHIISNVKHLNSKHKNAKVNSELQNFMFQMLAHKNDKAAKVSLDIMIELYRKHIWRDAKTVNVIATACFSPFNKVLVAALKFFLGMDRNEEKVESESEESDNDAPTVKEVMLANKVNKKSRKRMRILKKTKQVMAKSAKKNTKENFDFSAIHLLHDPQGMAEKLLKNLEKMNERYEIKLLVMNFISRLVGVHELILLNFYPLLMRYIQPRQKDVTKVLLFSAQATHAQVPPDDIGPLIKHIAQNFITERNSSEVITVGLNSIREICARAPFVMEQDLLQDLVEYQKYKDKNVTMAAKSIMQLYRQVNPKLLQRKYRCRPTEMTKDTQPLEYGALKAKSYIPGSESLPIEPCPEDETGKQIDPDEDESDGGWEDVSQSEEESDGGWEDVSHSECGEEDSETKDSPLDEKSEKDEPNSKEEKTDAFCSDQEKAMAVSHSRILSQEEFKKMKIAQIEKQVMFAKGKKRKADGESETKELVSLSDIERLHKKPKADKASRLASIREGREDRENFGRKNKKNPKAGKTQKEHNKKKNFQMMKHKLRSKIKRSFKDKQISLRNALIKQKKKNI